MSEAWSTCRSRPRGPESELVPKPASWLPATLASRPGRMFRPALQQGLQNTGCGTFAPRHAAGNADDIGALATGLAEELLQHPAATLFGFDIEIEQAGERQIDLFHFPQ